MAHDSGQWLDPPADLAAALSIGDVHVWRANLDLDPPAVNVLAGSLSPDEMERANRFRFTRDRNHFIAARAALRNILGRTCGIPSRSLLFSYNQYGKPALLNEPAAGIEFNVSHSHGMALFAVTRERAVGIDLELVRKEFAAFKIAERFFAPEEVTALRALHPDDVVSAFFNCWARKEAFIKARGMGFSLSLRSFSVSIAPGEPAALIREDGGNPQRWTLTEIFAGEEFRAALAVEGPAPRLRLLRWTPS